MNNTIVAIFENETKVYEGFTAGRMSRILAHEIRNPLTNINLAIGQLKEEMAKNENTAMLFDIVTRSSARINNLVTEMLNATSTQELKCSPISVNSLLDEALMLAADRAELLHIKVIKEYAPDICDVSVDAEKLKIAFVDLIVNAIEAMEADKGILRLKTERKSDKCVITVSDNGCGIDKESLSRLFEPFFTNKPKGKGLGLANTRAIILSHKGNIEVESEPGRGATFIVTLDFIEE